MKLLLFFIATALFATSFIYCAEIESEQIDWVEIPLQQLLPNNDATSFFKVLHSALPNNEQLGKLNLSSKKIFQVTGKQYRLLSIEGIEDLAIQINGKLIKAATIVTHLKLDDNSLSELPSALSQFRLTHLSIASNNLDAISDTIVDLCNTQLQSINISNNTITRLPQQLLTINPERLRTIRYCNVAHNPNIHIQDLIDFFSRIPRDHLNELLANRCLIWDEQL